MPLPDIISTLALVYVKNDLPWRFRVYRYSETTGLALPWPTGWNPAAQIRTPTTVINLGAPVESSQALAMAVFELAAAAYAGFAPGQLYRFAWWITDGTKQETVRIRPVMVIER